MIICKKIDFDKTIVYDQLFPGYKVRVTYFFHKTLLLSIDVAKHIYYDVENTILRFHVISRFINYLKN